MFVDPRDAEDIFPKDFLISLQRPPGYMGASDFHDIDIDFDQVERTFANSVQKAHVRFVSGQYEKKKNKALLEALDAFVLSGAIKLYREARGTKAFRHHTMLVHEGMRTAAHKELADRITDLWNKSGYYSATAYTRLRGLFDKDLGPVSRVRAGDIPTPNSFDEILPYLPKAIARIGGTRSPVLIVNSDKIESDQEKLDFDTTDHVWRILVGGNKLARGFTVEGLTVSYYTRVAKQADTMMQMGRWFGFRQNYQDLVRLYTTVELYEGFEAIVRDEEFFRSELRQYAAPVGGKPQVTPQDVPPLVGSHLPRIKPTAANKKLQQGAR
ncbi:hypothetical protein GCM10020001_034980 [Nonomuraea salmonea]